MAQNRVKEVVALRHVNFEHLGTLAPLFSGRGYRIRYLDVGIADLSELAVESPDLLVVLGGPIGVHEQAQYPWLSDELRLIEQRLRAERPILGICLGAQLMAHALGSRIYPGRAREIGWGQVTLSADGQDSCLAPLQACAGRVLHWHADTFDLPDRARRLASSEITENQAFSVGDKALALQFHLEADPAEIERWLVGHAHEIASVDGLTPSSIRADTARFGAATGRCAAECIGQWMQTANLLPAVPKAD